ncbi:phage terminase protein [Candidatus Termititenax aidoneus]|uniref:Phage terminase protein n=1 Tax=Termititenax aidoneus TaxID=2218524 RepID=A0A388TD00_TERA1|nr:phage terminase protein [Candidatus Termititenax aidoneus]
MAKLTAEERETISRAAHNELCRRSYVDYLRLVTHDTYIPAKFHGVICTKLEAVERGELKRLIVNLPPQHGKSATISDHFPSWYLGKHPSEHIICIAYGDDLAYRFGKSNRAAVEEYGGLFNVELSTDKAEMKNWETDSGGGMISTGIGGSITGHGAQIVIIDDPIKNRAEANSETYRKKIIEEYRSTIRTRLSPDGAIIVVMTRWHEADLCAWLMEQDKWELLSFPALAEEHDQLNRKLGAPLWPEFGYTAAHYAQIKKDLGSAVFAGLYQQRPAPQEGQLIMRAWIKTIDKIPDDVGSWTISVDATFSGGADPDYVSIQAWCASGANRYLADQIRRKMGLRETIEAIREMNQRWPDTYRVLIENKANGSAIIEVLTVEIQGIIPINPKSDKVTRLQAVSPQFEAGNIFILKAEWSDDYIHELTVFPAGKHDDQVDATTQALTDMRNCTDTFAPIVF